MALINVLFFVALKTFHNIAFVQKSLSANNCWRIKISKSARNDIAFILNFISETVIFLCQFFFSSLVCLVFVSFTKTCFYSKRGCITTCNYVVASLSAKWNAEFHCGTSEICELFASFNLTYYYYECRCQSSAIMV